MILYFWLGNEIVELIYILFDEERFFLMLSRVSLEKVTCKLLLHVSPSSFQFLRNKSYKSKCFFDRVLVAGNNKLFWNQDEIQIFAWACTLFRYR